MRTWLHLAALALAWPPLAQTAHGPVGPLMNDATALAPAGDTASQIAFAYADCNEDQPVTWEE